MDYSPKINKLVNECIIEINKDADLKLEIEGKSFTNQLINNDVTKYEFDIFGTKDPSKYETILKQVKDKAIKIQTEIEKNKVQKDKKIETTNPDGTGEWVPYKNQSEFMKQLALTIVYRRISMMYAYLKFQSLIQPNNVGIMATANDNANSLAGSLAGWLPNFDQNTENVKKASEALRSVLKNGQMNSGLQTNSQNDERMNNVIAMADKALSTALSDLLDARKKFIDCQANDKKHDELKQIVDYLLGNVDYDKLLLLDK